MVKCSECGFLAVRHRDTRELLETEKQFRCTGEMSVMPGQYETIPVCFVNSINITEEVEIIRKSVNDEPHRDSIGGYIPPHWGNHIKVVLNTERKCKSFTKWHQGFTPKEHKEMIDKEKERKWHLMELGLIIFGNILAACLGALLVYLVTRGG